MEALVLEERGKPRTRRKTSRSRVENQNNELNPHMTTRVHYSDQHTVFHSCLSIIYFSLIVGVSADEVKVETLKDILRILKPKEDSFVRITVARGTILQDSIAVFNEVLI